VRSIAVVAALSLSVGVAGCVPPGMRAAQERVEEARYVALGGIDQWVTLRGDDGRNPLLLLVHGGPGDVQSPLVETYAPYERDVPGDHNPP